MTFKEFSDWVNIKATTGQWGFKEASICMRVGTEVTKQWWWKREKYWQNHPERELVEYIIEVTEEKLRNYKPPFPPNKRGGK